MGTIPICRLLPAATAAALALSGTAGAATDSRVIGHGISAKGSRTATVTGGADAPRLLSVRVVATPAQQVSVTSSVICSKAGAQGNLSAPEHEMETAMKSRTFSARAPVTRRLAFSPNDPLATRQWYSVATHAYAAWELPPPLATATARA